MEGTASNFQSRIALIASPLNISGNDEINYPAQTTDARGFFTVSVAGLANGTYNWRVKDPKYLANSGSFTLVRGTVIQVEMALMRVGDCNDDNMVNASDFIILKNSFGRQIGEPNYDDRANFDGDVVVNSTDYALLRMNFGFGGAPPIFPVAPDASNTGGGQK